MATINIQDLSTALEANPRTVRKFLRSVTPVENQPGKGGRWQIEKKNLRSLKKQFETFLVEHTRTSNDEVAEVNKADVPETDLVISHFEKLED